MTIDKRFFEKNQKQLLWLANTKFGRWLFAFEKTGKSIKGKRITAIYPNAVEFTLGAYYDNKTREYKTKKRIVFITFNTYAVRLAKLLFIFPVIEIDQRNGKEFLLSPAWKLAAISLLGYITPESLLSTALLTTDTFNSTSTDGEMRRQTVDETFSALRSGDGNGSQTPTNTQAYSLASSTNSGKWTGMRRSAFFWDTSSLPDDADITGATISLYVTFVRDNLGGLNTNFTTHSLSSISNSGYNLTNWGTTALATGIASTSLSTNAYNDWTLNSSGIDAISLDGTTKIGARLESDINNSPPSWVSDKDCIISLNFGSNASNKPQLEVVYTVTTGGASNFFQLF